MAEEKQIEPGTPEKQAAAEIPPKPSYEEIEKEIERKEGEIKRLQGLLKDSQKRGIPREELDSLHKKIDDMQEWTAAVMDDLASRITPEEYEAPKLPKKTYSQLLKEKRAAQPQKTEQLEPAAIRFFNYLEDQNLELSDDIVKKAIEGTESPKEALKNLKAKLKADAEKRDAEKAQQLEEKLKKELGLTGSGAEGPSGPSSSWRELSPEEKLRRGVSK